MEISGSSKSQQERYTPQKKKPTTLKDALKLGNIPPQDVDMEKVVLGALMLEKDALSEVIEILQVDTFYTDKHRMIFNAIRVLFEKSDAIDMMTVTNQLRFTGELEMVGGAYAIAELTQRVNSAANIIYHSRILVQYAIKRELISISNEIQTGAFDNTTDVFELLDKMEQGIFEISEMNIRKNYVDMASIMAETFAELEEMKKHTDGLTGIPSGISDLDRVTSGWQKSDLIILAARPGMGKTAFVVSAMRNAAVDFGKGVAIFSLEMSAIQLTKRLISAEAKITSEKLKTAQLSPQEWDQLVTMTAKLQEAPIFIDDSPALSVLELRAKCRRLKARNDIQLIIIDYLQLMSGSTGKGGPGNREQEIALISRSLKQLAKELNVPVIALSQLSRAVETRGGDKRPQLSDLRESGSIEQDADMVAFLYRPEYYGITEDEEGNSTINMGEIIIAKHRNGSLKNVRLKFIKEYTFFTDWETDSFSDNAGFDGFDDFSPQGNSGGGGETMTLPSKMNNNLSPELGEAPF